MNLIKYIKLLSLAIAIFCFSACDDGLSDLNVDPNNPVAVPASNLLSQAQWQLYDIMQSRGLNGEWSMLMVQQWAQNEYAEESRYTVDRTSFDLEWQTLYADVLNELNTARGLISADENVIGSIKANQLAIVDILTAQTFQTLTELYGDLPYSQAMNAVDYPNPAYDSQADVWAGILSTLDNAVFSIDEGAGSFASGELIYGGDMTAWKKLGASLLFRAAMRVVDVDEALAGSYISKVGGLVISSNSENAMFVFDSDPQLANPLYKDAVISNRDDFAVTDVLVDNLTAFGDPRLEAFAKATNSGDIVGMPYGLTDGEAFALKDGTSRPNDNVRTATSPQVIIDYAEVAFLTAEARERGLMPGDAAEAYANGVTASMNYWGISDAAAIADYIANNSYDAANWKESLGWQKWIAFYMNGPQAWAEHRRLDQPVLNVPVAATNAVIPVRVPYPVSEEQRNGSSLSAVTSNPDDMDTKLWWDVN